VIIRSDEYLYSVILRRF